MIGQTVGHYRVVEQLGEGGMGEVWRARDLRLRRDVALKVLPEALASDPERRARFEREARAVAALADPHIGGIYGLEEAAGRSFLVLECVEGETLAARLESGALPLEEALDVGLHLAAGLEAAHAAGVIHRDLKPANVKLTPEGKVKILDFGLAKIKPEAEAEEVSHSPTLSYTMTQSGVLLGTAAYMSPEQASGRSVDKRADIWAFGCVLYECLAGCRPFRGQTVTDVLASLLKDEPDWERLPRETPRAVRRLLRRCLAKDVAQRLHDIGDARIELEEAVEGPPDAEAPGAQPAGRMRRRLVGWGLIAVAAIVLVVALAIWRGNLRQPVTASPHAAAPAPRSRYQLQPPRGVAVAESGASSTLAISRDGRWVAFRGWRPATGDQAGSSMLYLRSVTQLEANPAPGTEGATNPFFSPDSRWLGFWSRGALRKVSLDGGEAEVICQAGRLRGASWGEDRTIVFSAGEGLLRVNDEGGEPEVLTTPPPGEREIRHYWPHHLPGGRALLFHVHRGYPESESELAALSLATREQKTLLRGGSYPRYAAGHLVFGRLGTLYAARFDSERLALGGEPRAVLDDVYFYDGSFFVAFDMARTGALVFTPGAPRIQDSELVRVDRRGNVAPLVERRAPYDSLAPSPDGRRLAVVIFPGYGEGYLWTYDIERAFWTRITDDGKSFSVHAWTPDSRWILFTALVEGAMKIFRVGAEGGTPEQLTSGVDWDAPNSVSPDGGVLLFQRQIVTAQWDLLTLELDGDRTPRSFLTTPVIEGAGVFSPDGRWIAYQSSEEGSDEIYIRPYPGRQPRVRISSEGGSAPQWSPRGDEILYRCSTRSVCAVRVELGREPSVGRPVRLLTLDFLRDPWPNPFHVSRDGRHLYMVRFPIEHLTERRLVYAPDFAAELAGR